MKRVHGVSVPGVGSFYVQVEDDFMGVFDVVLYRQSHSGARSDDRPVTLPAGRRQPVAALIGRLVHPPVPFGRDEDGTTWDAPAWWLTPTTEEDRAACAELAALLAD